MIELRNWNMASNPWAAPEAATQYLVGEVYNDPRRPDGSKVDTSHVVASSGRIVTTESGTEYLLGDPSSGYREWLRENYPDWDPENPVTIVGTPS